ncbi:hypothetical protein CDD82_1147 [Ophiocordyceps australis]|uniref:Zn(2)-C6 fungal-type domain-containing protein n=1 Tax=Ophiocordyceps australis TaxID=1399860 RepID=A0A2C5XPD7_9HYPO|nr:hypothetical protein CDD82_1147 [Ophiocordyceps australis]
MVSVGVPFETAQLRLGQQQRMGNSKLAPDLGWADRKGEQGESVVSARIRAYPSPPMSGSPPLPPRAPREADEYPGAVCRDPEQDDGNTEQRRQRQFSTHMRRQEQHQERQQHPFQQPRHLQRHLNHQWHQLPPPPPAHHASSGTLSRSFPTDVSRGSFGLQPFDEAMPPTPIYSPQQPHRVPHQLPYPYPPQHLIMTTPGASAELAYSMANRTSALENQSFTSPKSQRKTKGHVASACVPCKRAHLRCDAQRPCSRCTGNGKEEACVDVQHKKRGRPRLRDDRDARFDSMRLSHYPDVPLRRPLSAHPASSSSRARHYDDALQPQRQQTYPSLETPMVAAAMPPRHLEPSSELGGYGMQSLHGAGGYSEPAAYLTMSMEFAKASSTFLSAVGISSLTGRRLGDILPSSEREKMAVMQRRLAAEQKEREPNYLPPILGLGGPDFQAMGFSSDELSRFSLDIEQHVTFVGSDRCLRPLGARLGLGKQGSFYFVVMLLTVPVRYASSALQTQTPRTTSTPFLHGGSSPGMVLASRSSGTPIFDPVRNRLGQDTSQAAVPCLGLSSHSYMASPTGQNARPLSPYDASSVANRGRIAGRGPHLVPESGLAERVFTAAGPGQETLQLPPIRAPQEQGSRSREQSWPRAQRSGRVDICGLIEKADKT